MDPKVRMFLNILAGCAVGVPIFLQICLFFARRAFDRSPVWRLKALQGTAPDPQTQSVFKWMWVTFVVGIAWLLASNL